jgi:hypothetical protein
VWLPVRILNSLVFSFSTTVRAIRGCLREAAHVCSAGAGPWLRGGSILTEGIRFEETDRVVLGDIRGTRKRCLGMVRKLLTDARETSYVI